MDIYLNRAGATLVITTKYLSSVHSPPGPNRPTSAQNGVHVYVIYAEMAHLN